MRRIRARISLQPTSNSLQPSSVLVTSSKAGAPLVASLLLVAMPFVPSSFLLLVAMASNLNALALKRIWIAAAGRHSMAPSQVRPPSPVSVEKCNGAPSFKQVQELRS